ncbi:MAG: hypothetical protein H7308_05335, partial [Chthonomonadaceae bacterium]|nr:hypothetical protein [Chthonomonadaceae bacterium]
MLIALMLSLMIGQTSPGAPLAANATIKPTPVPGISYRLQPNPLSLEIKEIRELVRLSDFIGFVQASNVWSFDEIVKIESLKGVFPIGSLLPKKIKSYEEVPGIDQRPLWMRLPDDKHEMLVFGRYVAERQGKVFTMLTGFRVASDLDSAGKKTQVILDSAGKSVVERNVLITLLTRLIKGEKPDATVLETFEKSLKIADNGWDA